MIATLCVICAAIGAAAGSLLTRRVNHQELRLARAEGMRQGRREQEHRTDFMYRRVIHLEAMIRRLTTSNGVRP